jgi:hypothetical protein
MPEEARRRRFVSREEFTAMSRDAPDVDLEAFRADQDAAADHEVGSLSFYLPACRA